MYVEELFANLFFQPFVAELGFMAVNDRILNCAVDFWKESITITSASSVVFIFLSGEILLASLDLSISQLILHYGGKMTGIKKKMQLV